MHHQRKFCHFTWKRSYDIVIKQIASSKKVKTFFFFFGGENQTQVIIHLGLKVSSISIQPTAIFHSPFNPPLSLQTPQFLSPVIRLPHLHRWRTHPYPKKTNGTPDTKQVSDQSRTQHTHSRDWPPLLWALSSQGFVHWGTGTPGHMVAWLICPNCAECSTFNCVWRSEKNSWERDGKSVANPQAHPSLTTILSFNAKVLAFLKPEGPISNKCIMSH